jgi:hypothetical protein
MKESSKPIPTYTKEDICLALAGRTKDIAYFFLLHGGIFYFCPETGELLGRSLRDNRLSLACEQYIQSTGRNFGSFDELYDYAKTKEWPNAEAIKAWKMR